MFTLYHTNDFHNHLTKAQAERLRLLRASAPLESLLLDAGDAGGSGNLTFRPGGEPILDLMSEAGYDAMTVGNRDFHLSHRGFYTKISRAQFPVLCANVRRNLAAVPDTENVSRQANVSTGEAALPVTPYLYREMADGLRVFIFGLTVPMITEQMLSRKVSAWVFDRPVPFAARWIPKWREEFRPDLMIALTHIGINQDRLLAETVPGIDLIVGGHSHTVLETGEQAGETFIVQTGFYGHSYGVVAMERESERWRMTARLETL